MHSAVRRLTMEEEPLDFSQAWELKARLEQRSDTVIMTRETDMAVNGADGKDRVRAASCSSNPGKIALLGTEDVGSRGRERAKSLGQPVAALRS